MAGDFLTKSDPVARTYLLPGTVLIPTLILGAVWVNEGSLAMFFVLHILADVACAIFESDLKTQLS